MKFLSTIVLLSFSLAGFAADGSSSTDLSTGAKMLDPQPDASQSKPNPTQSGDHSIQTNEFNKDSFVEQVIENEVKPKH